MTLDEKLTELEQRLERIEQHLEAEEFDAAREEATEIGDTIDCQMCEQIETGVLGGIMFAAAFTPERRRERVDVVTQEIARFRERDLQVARDMLAGLPAEEVSNA